MVSVQKRNPPAGGSPSRSGAEVQLSHPPEVLARTISRLRVLAAAAGVELHLRIAEVIAKDIYDGDISGWRERGKKSAALRSLAEHPDLPFSPATVYRSLELFEFASRAGGLSRWPYLGVAHFRAALALPVVTQTQVLDDANERRWTVRQLERAITQQLVPNSRASRGGRRPLSRPARLVRGLRRQAAEVDEQAIRETRRVDPIEAEALLSELMRIQATLDILRQALSRRAKEDA